LQRQQDAASGRLEGFYARSFPRHYQPLDSDRRTEEHNFVVDQARYFVNIRTSVSRQKNFGSGDG
jgi:hypothetical protein